MDTRFRPTERIQRPSEFRRVLRNGKCLRDPVLRIHYLETDRELSRLGLVVSRKLGNAVTRNRLKRMLREIFRHLKSRFWSSLDVVVIPDRRAGPRDRAAYQKALERLLTQRDSRSVIPRGSSAEARGMPRAGLRGA